MIFVFLIGQAYDIALFTTIYQVPPAFAVAKIADVISIQEGDWTWLGELSLPARA